MPDSLDNRFLAPDAAPGDRLVRLPADEAHHLSRVLRLGVDARIRVFNGKGAEWEGRVAAIDRSGVTVALDRSAAPLPEPRVKITLGIGLLKGDQMDDVIRDATALGVQAIAPIASAHVTVARRAWRSGGPIERWHRIAVASAKQCGRALVPEIQAIAAFDQVLASTEHALVVMAIEPAATGLPDLVTTSPPSSVLALVGPEGGWAAEEIELVAARGARAVRLGPRRLRAEIAPTVLLSSLWTRWGW